MKWLCKNVTTETSNGVWSTDDEPMAERHTYSIGVLPDGHVLLLWDGELAEMTAFQAKELGESLIQASKGA